MKKFSQMAQGEINAMSAEEFAAVSPFEKKSCYDCVYLKSALSWWCTNKEAKNARGTSLPGGVRCPFWGPKLKLIDDKFKE